MYPVPFLVFGDMLQYIPRLTLQECAECLDILPGYRLTFSKLLERGLAQDLLLTYASSIIPCFFQGWEYVYLVNQRHKGITS